MSLYRTGIGTSSVVVPSPVAELVDSARERLSAYQRGAGMMLEGSRYFHGKAVRVGASRPVNQVASFVVGSVHVALLIAGVAAVAR